MDFDSGQSARYGFLGSQCFFSFSFFSLVCIFTLMCKLAVAAKQAKVSRVLKYLGSVST